MHRKEQFLKLVIEWIELELPYTCTSLDTHTSMRIEKNKSRVIFTQKRSGRDLEVGQVMLNMDNKPDSGIFLTSAPTFGLMIYALEKAIETN